MLRALAPRTPVTSFCTNVWSGVLPSTSHGTRSVSLIASCKQPRSQATAARISAAQRHNAKAISGERAPHAVAAARVYGHNTT